MLFFKSRLFWEREVCPHRLCIQLAKPDENSFVVLANAFMSTVVKLSIGNANYPVAKNVLLQYNPVIAFRLKPLKYSFLSFSFILFFTSFTLLNVHMFLLVIQYLKRSNHDAFWLRVYHVPFQK
jgi:hypothetical protein